MSLQSLGGEWSSENWSSTPPHYLFSVTSHCQPFFFWRRWAKHRNRKKRRRAWGKWSVLGRGGLLERRQEATLVFLVDFIRLSIQTSPPGSVPFWKSPSWAHGGIGACVTAAHVYHPPPRALSTEGKVPAWVRCRKSHLDVAFVVNNLGARLPPSSLSLPGLLLESLFHELPKQPLICVLVSGV